MNYLVIVGGAVIGVGAVAAAPFTGGGSLLGAASLATSLAGAGTIAAATGAAAVGTAVGVGISSIEKDKLQKKIDTQKTMHELEKKKIIEKLEIILQDTTKIYDYFIAMHAIGIAAANADGYISKEESQEIEEFVCGVMSCNFPDSVKSQIQNLTDNPPSLQTAYAFLKNTGLTEKGWNDIDDLIEIVINADDYKDEKETAFREAWNTLRNTA